MAGIFEHDLAFDESAKVASRKAAAVAHKRASDRFGTFLANSTGDDFHQRFALIEDEVAEIAQDVADEYGADSHQLLVSMTSVLAAGGFCDDCRKWKSGPKAGCECGSENESSPDTTDTGSSDEEEPSEAKEARTARWVVGDFPGGYGSPGHDAEFGNAGLGEPGSHIPGPPGEELGDPGDPSCPSCGAPGYTGHCTNCGCYDGWEADSRDVAQGRQDRADFYRDRDYGDPPRLGAEHTAEALETESLPTGDESALDGPSPKIDKKEWKPNALNEDGNLSPIDTEGAGSPHPTVQQDVTDVADHTADPLDQTDAVTESQDVGKETTTEAIHTDTWSGKDGQADPVTSATQDVEKNPIREMIRSGIIPQTQVEAAISQFENRPTE